MLWLSKIWNGWLKWPIFHDKTIQIHFCTNQNRHTLVWVRDGLHIFLFWQADSVRFFILKTRIYLIQAFTCTHRWCGGTFGKRKKVDTVDGYVSWYVSLLGRLAWKLDFYYSLIESLYFPLKSLKWDWC